MPPHVHHLDHRHPGRTHPPAPIASSILRLAGWHRLAGAAVLIAALWAAVLWAMA
jgi:hypothetical protein